MHLTYRPATEEDIDSCVALIPEAWARIPTLWRSWLRRAAMHLTVLEDETRPSALRLAAFGCSVFLTDDFAQEVHSGLPPHVSAQVYERAVADRAPILDASDIRKESASAGLNLLVLHIGWPESDFDEDEIRQIKARLVEAFFYTHAGYPIREIMQEVHSPEEMRRATAAGLIVYNDYADYWRANPHLAPPERLMPYLMGVDRERAREGSYIAPVFVYTAPRFFFSVSEQELLRLALLDKTDEEMARALHVSESAVQKRWQAIFDRASASTVRWLPTPAEPERSDRVRGVEKRRHLLSYLRSHPEELRPTSPRRAKP